jgi:hypothetical protein
LIAAKQKQKERHMSEPTKPEANPDDLTKKSEPESTDLTEAELDRMSGGSTFVLTSAPTVSSSNSLVGAPTDQLGKPSKTGPSSVDDWLDHV